MKINIIMAIMAGSIDIYYLYMFSSVFFHPRIPMCSYCMPEGYFFKSPGLPGRRYINDIYSNFEVRDGWPSRATLLVQTGRRYLCHMFDSLSIAATKSLTTSALRFRVSN